MNSFLEPRELQVWARVGWITACGAFDVWCRASGTPLDTATVARMDTELRQIAADNEHVGLTDFQVLQLALNRVRPTSIAKAERAATAVLARVMGGQHE